MKVIREHHRNQQKNLWSGALICLVLGVLFIIWGLGGSIADKNFYANCETATGHLAKVSEVERDNGSDYYIGVYYYNVNHTPYEVSTEELQTPPQEGDYAIVFYDPENPSKSTISPEDTFKRNTEAVGLSIFGSIWLLFGVLFLPKFNNNSGLFVLVMGIILVLIGIGFPLIFRSGWLLFLLGIGGILLIIRGFLLLSGRGKIVNEYDKKFNHIFHHGIKKLASESQKRAMEEQSASHPEEVIPEKVLPGETGQDEALDNETILQAMDGAEQLGAKVVSGFSFISSITPIATGLFFVAVAIVGMVALPDFPMILGIIFLVAGIGSVIAGIVTMIKSLKTLHGK